MRAAQLTGIFILNISWGFQGISRTAHAAFGRGSFSFRNSHRRILRFSFHSRCVWPQQSISELALFTLHRAERHMRIRADRKAEFPPIIQGINLFDQPFL